MIQLTGYVDLPALCPVVEIIWSRVQERRQVRYLLECSSVSDISSGALVEIVKLQQELQAEGLDLVLANCPPPIREKLQDRSLHALLDEPETRRHPVPQAVQLAIRYMRGLEFTYYWLN